MPEVVNPFFTEAEITAPARTCKGQDFESRRDAAITRIAAAPGCPARPGCFSALRITRTPLTITRTPIVAQQRRLRLVDVDIAWIPPLPGAPPPTESGLQNYQPPARQASGSAAPALSSGWS